MTTRVKKNQRPLTGKVISNKMDKTIVVEVSDILMHPQFNKYQKRSRKILAHDETNSAQVGDTVLIEQCRPYSKRVAHIKVEVVAEVAL
jgi:small subunit ribosomal protein S17